MRTRVRTHGPVAGLRAAGAALAITAAVALAPPAPAAAVERGKGLPWLMNEPVTLFDLGLLRLKEDLAETAEWLIQVGLVSERPVSGAYYEWRNRRIVAYLSVRDSFDEPNEAMCREVFGRAARQLVRQAPGGPRQAEIYLENVFLHEGPGNFGRPKTLGAELLEAVRFEITLLPPPPVSAGGKRVQCSGRLDTEPEALSMSVSG